MHSHQDWNIVILHNKSQTVSKEIHRIPRLKHNNDTLVSVHKLYDNLEDFKHKRVSKEIADKIKAKRIELKMTQSDLARKINVPLIAIQDIEAMKSVYDHKLLNKIKRVIGF